MSLVTGKVRSARTQSDAVTSESDPMRALVTQETQISELHRNGGGEFLAEKSWQGLERKLGETPVTKAVQGQTGIPMGYHDIEAVADPR